MSSVRNTSCRPVCVCESLAASHTSSIEEQVEGLSSHRHAFIICGRAILQHISLRFQLPTTIKRLADLSLLLQGEKRVVSDVILRLHTLFFRSTERGKADWQIDNSINVYLMKNIELRKQQFQIRAMVHSLDDTFT